jgi:hypothetical protein
VALSQLLAGGTTFANMTTVLLTDIQQPYAQLTAASGPFLNSLSQTPTTIARILAGLNSWAETWVKAENGHPYLTLSATAKVNNVSDFAAASLGESNVAQLLNDALGPAANGTNLVNPPTYGPACRPTSSYGTVGSCPQLSNAITAAALRAGSQVSGNQVAILAEPQQQEAVAKVAAGLNGNVPPSSPSVSTLILEPVLASVASHR